MRRVLIALAAAASVPGAVPAHAARWERPVAGPVVIPFDYGASTPFRAGARRGAGLAARPGQPVRAACSGPIRYAGRSPGGGSVVSVRCGGWHVTHLGLDAPTGARRVAAGDVVGTAAGRVVRLGVRRAASRWGYVDPEGLLPPRPPAAGPGPPAAVPRSRRPLPRWRGSVRGSGAVVPSAVPWTVGAGAALVLAGLGATLPVRRARLPLGPRRRPAAAAERST